MERPDAERARRASAAPRRRGFPHFGVWVAAAICAAAIGEGESIAVKAADTIPWAAPPDTSDARADMATDVDPGALILPDRGPVAASPLSIADARFASRARDRWGFSYERAVRGGRGEGPLIGRELDAAARMFAAGRLDGDALGVRLPANDFSDAGPGTVKFAMAGLDVDALRSVAGGRVELTAAEDERGRVVVESRLSWLFEYLQTDAAAAAFFAPGDKGIFAVQGLSYGSNWALLGVGLRWQLAGGWTAFAGYDAQANSQQMFHIGSAGFGYAW